MTSHSKKTGVVTVIVMVVVIVLCSFYFFLRDKSEVQKRNNTPAAAALLPEQDVQSFTDLQGKPITLASHFGTLIVVTSWASWCPQCIADLSRLGEVAQVYKDKEVVFLAVNRAEDKYTAERFLQTITLPVEVQIVLDPEDFYFKQSAGFAMPETILYGKDGTILLQQRGELRLDELKQNIDASLK